MRLNVQAKNKKEYVYLPMNENDLDRTCKRLDIKNNMTDTVTAIEDYNENRLTNLLKNKPVNLDKLNFLVKSLERFTTHETQTFYAVATAKNYTTLNELIDLSFNTHCYSLINDFKDLNELGKSLYLNEQTVVNSEELERFNGERYINEMMKNNPEPLVSRYGFVYPNSNTPEIVYNGGVYPPYLYKPELITAEISINNVSEYIFLPYEETAVLKALERMNEKSIDDVVINKVQFNLPTNVSNIVKDADLNTLNEFAKAVEVIHKSDYEFLSKLVGFCKIDNLDDLKVLTKSIFDVEIYPNIFNAKDYGEFIITESGRFEYDDNLKEYIDFEKYAQDKLKFENGVFTENGYINYQGYNEDMTNLLNRNLNMNLEFTPYSETLRIYMPIEVSSYYEENAYGGYEYSDYKETLNSDELSGFEDELNEYISSYQSEFKTDRKLMEYYDEKDVINSKVHSYHFEFEEVDTMYAVAVCKLNAPLEENELESLKNLIEGQASDGVGEGFEQQDLDFNGRYINISIWDSDESWELKTAAEMRFNEQTYEIGGLQY